MIPRTSRFFSTTLLCAAFALPLVLSGTAMAGKPSLRRAIKDMGYKDVISCKFISSGKITQVSFRLWYTRAIECKRRGGVPGKPRIKKITDGYVEYAISGRRYIFAKFIHWTTKYVGLPAPKPSLVVALVKANKMKFLGRRFNLQHTVGDLHGVRIDPKPQWSWSSPNHLSVRVAGRYYWKKGNSAREVQHVEHTKLAHLKRASMRAPWTFDKFTKTSKSADRRVLSVKSYSPAQYKAMKTIQEAAEDNAAASHMAALPKVTIPAFRSADEMIRYTFRMLRTATPKQLEAYLRQVYSSWYFAAGSTLILHNEAEKKMRMTIAAASHFKEQYCSAPVRRDNVSFWNKDKSTWIRIVAIPGAYTWVDGRKVPGTYKLSALQIGILKGDKLARMRSYRRPLCPKPLSAAQRSAKVAKAGRRGYWHIGDRISCAFKHRRRYYSGKVLNISGTRLFIKYDDGDTEWTTAAYCR